MEISSLILLDPQKKWRCGGGTGIRTLEGCYTLLVFKTSAFNRSAIPPAAIAWLHLQVYTFSRKNCINYLLFAQRMLSRYQLISRGTTMRWMLLSFGISCGSCAMLAPVNEEERNVAQNELLNCTMLPISRCDENQGCIESEMKECYRAWFTKAPPVTEGFHRELIECFIAWRRDNPHSNEESGAWRLCLHTLR